MRWEYQFLPAHSKRPPEEIMKSLNALGEKGWEMAGALPSETGTIIILKRQVSQVANVA